METTHSESLGDLAKKHPAGTAVVVIGGVFLLLRLRQKAAINGGPIPVPTDTGMPNYSPVGGQGGVSGGPDLSSYQQQTAQAVTTLEQQIQALSQAANQHAQASGQVAQPLNYDPSRGAYAGFGAISGDLSLYSAQSAATLPAACNFSKCQGVFGCIGHAFSTAATCGWRAVQTVGLAAGSVFTSPQAAQAGLTAATGGASQIPGSLGGYGGFGGNVGGYGGYGYTPGIAPGISYGGGASIIPQIPSSAPASAYQVSSPIIPAGVYLPPASGY